MTKKKAISTGKIIRIECEAAALISIDELTPLQGELKVLSEESYQSLRTSIIDLGYSFPVHAWKEKKTIWILDAHQRVATLIRMRDEEGYKIPLLPVAWVNAANKKEAAKKLLASASQYGEVTSQGLFTFMQDFGIDISQMETHFHFPEIDFTAFRNDFFPSGEPAEGDDAYTKKIESPIYEPKGTKPEIADLYDLKKANEMIEKISASDLPKEVKSFLTLAAYRHVVFNYENIAEFYAHSPAKIQDFMESSALVIIDFNKAIENGFVVLTEKIAEAYRNAE